MPTENINHPKLLEIKGPPYANQRRRVVGIERGLATSPHNLRTRKAIAIAEGMLHRLADVRSNRNYGPAEIQGRIREAVAPALRELNQTFREHHEAKESLRTHVNGLSPVKGNRELSFAEVMHDIELCKYYAALPLAQRAAVTHQLVREPIMQWRLAEALLRVPRELSGIEQSKREAIRFELLKVTCSTEFENANAQMEESAIAETALRMAFDAARESSSTTDVMEFAPDAFEAFQGGSNPVGWPSTPAEVRSEKLASQETAPSPIQGACDADT